MKRYYISESGNLIERTEELTKYGKLSYTRQVTGATPIGLQARPFNQVKK